MSFNGNFSYKYGHFFRQILEKCHIIVIIKSSNSEIVIRKARDDKRYKAYISKFKQVDIGMLVVMQERPCQKKIIMQLHH